MHSIRRLAPLLLLAAPLVAAPGDSATMKDLMQQLQVAMMKRDIRAGAAAHQAIQRLAQKTWVSGDLEPGGLFYLRSHADMHRQLKQPGLLEQLPPQTAKATRVPLARAMVWQVAQGNTAGAALVLKDALRLTSRDRDQAKAVWLLVNETLDQASKHRAAVLDFLAGALDKALTVVTGREKLVAVRARSLAMSEIAQGYRKALEGAPPTSIFLARAKAGAEAAAKEMSLPADRRLLPICFYLSEKYLSYIARGKKALARAMEPAIRRRYDELVKAKGKGAVWGFLSSTLADMSYQRDPKAFQRTWQETLNELQSPQKKPNSNAWDEVFGKPKAPPRTKEK